MPSQSSETTYAWSYLHGISESTPCCYTVFRYLHWLVTTQNRLQKDTVTFPIRGHSYMECDKDFGLLNQKIPAKVPRDWWDELRRSRKKSMSIHRHWSYTGRFHGLHSVPAAQVQKQVPVCHTTGSRNQVLRRPAEMHSLQRKLQWCLGVFSACNTAQRQTGASRSLEKIVQWPNFNQQREIQWSAESEAFLLRCVQGILRQSSTRVKTLNVPTDNVQCV